MQTELITVTHGDISLDGVLYRAKPNNDRVVYLIHGRSMNFYSGFPRFMAPALTAAGYDCLALNRRSRSVLTLTNNWISEGDAVSTSAEQFFDVELGFRHLQSAGYTDIVVAGHSQGGFLAAHLVAKEPDVTALILASSVARIKALPNGIQGEQRTAIVQAAEAAMATNVPDQMIALGQWPWVMSAASITQDFDHDNWYLGRFLADIQVPILSIYGTADIEPMLAKGAQKAFQTASSTAIKHVVIDGMDHFYTGFEEQIQSVVVEWLRRRFV